MSMSLVPHMGPLSWGMLGIFLVIVFLIVFKMFFFSKSKLSSVSSLKDENKKSFFW